MNYESAELRERLAAEYVLGTMPRLTRQRFERLIAEDVAVARLVADWAERFAPIDTATPEADPPPRVWRAIERRVLTGQSAAAPRPSWLGSLVFWRGVAFAAAAAAAVLVLYIAVSPMPPAPIVVAILDDGAGKPGWLALSGPRRAEISIAALRPLAGDSAHSFELWGIKAGAPRPLGLLQPRPDRPLIVQAARLPPVGGMLAVSVEPPNGSPTGLPTGPILYRGEVINQPP